MNNLVVIESISDYLREANRLSTSHDLILYRGQNCDYLPVAKVGRKEYNHWLANLKKNFALFKEKARRHIKLEAMPENDYEWLALAQHHGMATNFLDWTTNPLVALWFAIDQPINGNNFEPTIWVYLLWLFSAGHRLRCRNYRGQ